MTNNFKVNINEHLQECDSKDVISFDNQNWINIEKLKDIIGQSFYANGISYIVSQILGTSNFKSKDKINSWFYHGEECEILRAGSQGWQKGKIKVNVTLEFIPDESEEMRSPLDDVRQELDRDTEH